MTTALAAMKEFRRISVDQIRVNPYQPRKLFSQEALDSLAESIKRYGVITPLTVRRVRTGYELVAGERRLRAARLAGLDTVPCYIVSASSEDSGLMALLENLQREDLDFFEEAESLRRLTEDFGMTQQQAAQRIGKTQSAVANKLRLLRLSPECACIIREGRLTERHARVLLRLAPERQEAAAREMIRMDMNVSRAEQYVDKLLTPKPKQTCKLVLRDVRIFCNSLKKNLQTLKSSGIPAEWSQIQEEDALVISIRVPTPDVSRETQKSEDVESVGT